MPNETRRGFLSATLGSAWTAGALLEQSVVRAAAARSQAPAAERGLFRIEKMAPGVYGALAAPATQVNCNAVIFEMAEGLLVVDTHSKPSAAASLVGQIRREVSPKPVRFLVNTHFHWDHTQGTSAYRKAFPRMDLISSEATRKLLVGGGGGAGFQSSIDGAERNLELYRKRLAEAPAQGREALAKMVADTESFLKEMRGNPPELPAITVTGDLIVHDKEQDLHVVFRGRGHTAGDVSVWSPARRALATGDLAQGALPYMGDGYPKDWPVTLAGVGMLAFDCFLGGHGGVERSRQRMDQLRNYIEELTAAVEQKKRAGKSVEVVQKEITPAALKSLGGGYLEALGGLERVTGGVAGNVAQVYATLDRRPEEA
jgi:glyoxylase-like metal-dependent hydrolase (beta-lactamase superfamily II)